MALLDAIKSPADLTDLSGEQLVELAEEIRAFLIEEVSRTGGHLGPNLGVVELTIALHRVFDSPRGLLEFIKRLRRLSSGKPVGFKLCVGKRREFLAVCKAMAETGITPDFIVVDGGEGGTGAAPLEFSNHIGAPLVEGLIFVHNVLIGYALRDRIRVIASGKVTSGFDLLKRLALGADACYSARALQRLLAV